MPPSQLSIATSAVQRLLKEEASYRQEQSTQEKRLADMQALPSEKRDENWDFGVRQEVCLLSTCFSFSYYFFLGY